jgi:hypothetical protein
MSRVENFSRFQVFVEVWCSMRERNLLCFAVLWDEEKFFTHALSCHENVERKSFWSLLVALRFARGVELKTSWLFRMFLALILNWYDWFLATTRSKARRHSVFTCNFLQIPVLNENIFPHAFSGDFFHAWNIKLSTKTWNRRKFSNRVISKVYCSMHKSRI